VKWFTIVFRKNLYNFYGPYLKPSRSLTFPQNYVRLPPQPPSPHGKFLSTPMDKQTNCSKLILLLYNVTNKRLLTNSRKHEDDYHCVAKLTAEDSQYYNTISAPNVSPHVPPPLYRLYSWRTA